MEDLKALKSAIVNDWKIAFPQLSYYGANKFYKVIGPIIIGLELINLPRGEGYRPYFGSYPLWKSNIKECLDVPIVLKEFENKKGLQFSIPYQKHSFYFPEVFQVVKNELKLLFYGDVSLKNLLEEIDNYLKEPTIGVSPKSYLLARVLEAKLKIAVYVGERAQIDIALDQIKNIEWDIEHFRRWNVDYGLWINEINDAKDKRDELISQIKINRNDHKIAKLNFSELI